MNLDTIYEYIILAYKSKQTYDMKQQMKLAMNGDCEDQSATDTFDLNDHCVKADLEVLDTDEGRIGSISVDTDILSITIMYGDGDQVLYGNVSASTRCVDVRRLRRGPVLVNGKVFFLLRRKKVREVFIN